MREKLGKLWCWDFRRGALYATITKRKTGWTYETGCTCVLFVMGFELRLFNTRFNSGDFFGIRVVKCANVPIIN